MKNTLVVMAAGLGSRFGGIKQMEGLGPKGEILMEYSIYDAIRAGFNKIVLIIKPEMLDDIKKLCGDRLEKEVDIHGDPIELVYVFQDYSSLPAFYTIPPERTKPFGTVHALLCAKRVVNEPFVVLNADDYYGINAFKTIYEEINAIQETGEATMVGYMLKNTVSENGSVTRGLCSYENCILTEVTETYKIKVFPDGTIRDTEKDPSGVILDPNATVSMNFWGFTPWIFTEMEDYFNRFLESLDCAELKRECPIPVMIDDFIRNGKLQVTMIESDAVWFGITYREDKAAVETEIKKLHTSGCYPTSLR